MSGEMKRLKSLVIMTSCLLLPGAIFPGNLFAETVIEEWVARYNGPANLEDGPRAIALDDSGNVYVTGDSDGFWPYTDYATIKYDTKGNELWVARYDGPGNGYDSASAIARDTLGNIYVTGASVGISNEVDYATIKYDTGGNELWVARYDGPASLDDSATDIAVDSLGNVYVTGYSHGIDTDADYTTIKYDTNGNQLWVTRYNGLGNHRDHVTDMAVDSSGNVYVTGYSIGAGTRDDYATVKYDTNGNELWVARYNGPANDWDNAHAIAVDTAGNVYVTGSDNPIGGTYTQDYATVKYDANGNQLWVARYDGPASLADDAWAMAVDTSGNVYVTGRSDGGGMATYFDYATVKYDTGGNELWVARYDGPANHGDVARAIALDISGNVYVTGTSAYEYGSYDCATIKYAPGGNELWVARYDGPANDSDHGYAIALDATGNVYVTGVSSGSGTDYDYATIKYSQPPAPTWPAGSALTASDVSITSLMLTWTPAEDEVGVTEYLLFRDGTLIATVPAIDLSCQVTGLDPNTEYSFKVEACDAEGYCSNDGPSVTVRTLTPVGAIQALAVEVMSLNLQNGIENQLDAKLDAVLQALDDINANNDVAAVNTLEAFINAVEAQGGDKIEEADALALIAAANQIIAVLNAI